jgi:hypothetical protein
MSRRSAAYRLIERTVAPRRDPLGSRTDSLARHGLSRSREIGLAAGPAHPGS